MNWLDMFYSTKNNVITFQNKKANHTWWRAGSSSVLDIINGDVALVTVAYDALKDDLQNAIKMMIS